MEQTVLKHVLKYRVRIADGGFIASDAMPGLQRSGDG